MFQAQLGNLHMHVMSQCAGLHRCTVRGMFLLMCDMTSEHIPQNKAHTYVEKTPIEVLDISSRVTDKTKYAVPTATNAHRLPQRGLC